MRPRRRRVQQGREAASPARAARCTGARGGAHHGTMIAGTRGRLRPRTRLSTRVARGSTSARATSETSVAEARRWAPAPAQPAAGWSIARRSASSISGLRPGHAVITSDGERTTEQRADDQPVDRGDATGPATAAARRARSRAARDARASVASDEMAARRASARSLRPGAARASRRAADRCARRRARQVMREIERRAAGAAPPSRMPATETIRCGRRRRAEERRQERRHRQQHE